MYNTIKKIIEADSHGIDYREDLKAELALINQVEADLKALKQARRELAVEAGYAQFKTVIIKEHIRKEHPQTRFYWNK